MGDQNGALPLIAGVLFAAIYLTFLAAFLVRLKNSIAVEDKFNTKMNNCCVVGGLCLVIGSIDPLGQYGRAPYQLYFICDEIAAAALLLAAFDGGDGLAAAAAAVAAAASDWPPWDEDASEPT